MSLGNIEDGLEKLEGAVTPFLANKTAEQSIDFDIDPSKGLTKKRYKWYSNNTLFDNTHFIDIAGGIEVSTSSTGTDTARIQSNKAGQYRSQTLSVPGVGFTFNSSNNLTVAGDGTVSLDNGLVAIGAGWHAGTNGGWNVSTNDVITFLGFKIDTSGVQAVLVSNGTHQADSPVSQEDWNIDTLDGSGSNRKNPSGLQFDPEKGYIWNGPYTWYNQGALVIGFVDKSLNKFIPVHRFEVDKEPSLDRPNLPTQLILDNDGDATSLTVDLGGMQYSRYGSGTEASTRTTPTSRFTDSNFVADSKVTNNNSLDARAEPGVPLVSVQSEQSIDDTVLTVPKFSTNVNNDIYVLQWDEFNPGSALTGANFRDPHSNLDAETKILVDTEASDYTPSSDAVFRGYDRIEGGNNDDVLGSATTDDTVPIGATRVITAVHDGSAADVTPIKVDVEEGY